uniref:hypothetical protein n=1 Tax=Thaumasiovibrio occultus TaxID=1891184 RepID=UPI000B35F045|nr:hypothetical protein [Thaumasiovibrio occultus]
MKSSLVDGFIRDLKVTESQVECVLSLSLDEHRYALSHGLDGTSVIPSVFMIEMALGVLAQTPFKDYVKPNAMSFRDITAPRLAIIPEKGRANFYINWRLSDDNSLTLKFGCDKMSATGQIVRKNVAVMTAVMDNDASCSVPTIAEYRDSLSPLYHVQDLMRRTRSNSRLGSIFSNNIFSYSWCEQQEILLGLSEIRDSEAFYLQHTRQPEFITAISAAFTCCSHLVCFNRVMERKAWPSNIGRLTYLGPWTSDGVEVLILGGKSNSSVDVLAVNQEDGSPIAFYQDYQMVQL